MAVPPLNWKVLKAGPKLWLLMLSQPGHLECCISRAMTWSNSALRHLSWPLWHQKKSSLASDRWNLTKRCFFQSCCRPSRKAGTAKRKIGIGATATFRLRGRPSRRGPKVRIAAKAPNRPDRRSTRRSKSRLWKGDHWLFLVRGGCSSGRLWPERSQVHC